jgi:hypothetical protein
MFIWALVTRAFVCLVSMIADAIRWDIGNSSLRGEIPVTIFALAGAILGALVAGIAGAVVFAVVGAYCAIFFRDGSAAEAVC